MKIKDKNIISIESLIENYSKVYQAFEDLQGKKILPGGDQKTGVIGEYYIHKYIRNKYRSKTEYGVAGGSYDVRYLNRKKWVEIQVKTVSAHSKTRTISSINLKSNSAWTMLYLLSLDKKFKPNGLWINKRSDLAAKHKGEKLSGQVMEDPNSRKVSGSTKLNFTDNVVNELKKY